MALLWILLATLLIVYLYFKRIYGYWDRRDIPCLTGAIPPIGHLLPVITVKKSLADVCVEMYEKYWNCSMVGFYNGLTPALLVRDPELAKIVMQTNFSHFQENLLKLDRNMDPLLAYNPFFNTGEQWTTSRKRLTYAFSSMRLKLLAETVRQVCTKFDNFLRKQLESRSRVEHELKDLFARFTGEVVANSALGIEGFCFDQPDNPNSMKNIVSDLFAHTIWNTIVQQITFTLPMLSKVIKVRFLSQKVDDYLRNTVAELMEQRKKDDVRRNDFLQLMSDMEKTEGENMDVETLTAYVLSFILDGFETTATTLSFVGYELASHPQVQDRLREEVRQVLAKHDNVIGYDSLKEMKYMDQVISESQRLHPILRVFGKICTQEMELKGEDGMVCRVEPGTEIHIAAQSLQTDPKYWNNAESFDPDRFSEENKNDIRKFTFLPFGEGPRICVGMRMGLLQTKACLAALIRDYKLHLSPKTRVPLKLEPGNFFVTPIGGLWAYIERV